MSEEKQLPKLPPWAKYGEQDDRWAVTIHADTAGYVAAWASLLKVPEKAFDQYWLETFYQCAKLDLQLAIEGSDLDPQRCGKPAQFLFSRSEPHALKRFPEGKGAMQATKGREAREHFRRVRGRIPMST